MIIDAHAHLGYDQIFEEEFTAQELLAAQRDNGIDLTLVQPGTVQDLETVRSQHDVIAALVSQERGRFAGIANPNPHLPRNAYEKELRRCVEQLGFIGVKLNPFAHVVNPLSKAGRCVFALAREFNLPVIVHTGSGLPWSAPSLLADIAHEHPALPIIAAHAGSMVLTSEAYTLARHYPNVYLECSWIGGFIVKRWADELGADRLLFGSDHADNAATEIAKFRTCGMTDAQLQWALGGTARKVFRIRET